MVNALRVKFQDETDNLQLRYNRDKGDLKEKPLNYSADSMSKVGLYSASAVAFNPAIGVQQKQLSALDKIMVSSERTAIATMKYAARVMKDPYMP